MNVRNKEGDGASLKIEAGNVHIVRRESVVARTAGALGSDMAVLDPEEERATTEHAIASDALERMDRK